MSVVDTLMETAAVDADLLRKLDAQGDHASVPRDVEFLLKASSADHASVVASFINDCRYGVATAQGAQDSPRVLVVVHMPVQQHAIQSVSGFMACVGEMFGMDYDGWRCAVQKART